MIIANGTIEFKAKQPSGIDPETGYPIKATATSWSDPIPCQYLPVSLNLRAKIGGEPISTASYTILVEAQPLPDSEQIRLTASNDKTLGEFSLQSTPEYLHAVDQIRLTV